MHPETEGCYRNGNQTYDIFNCILVIKVLLFVLFLAEAFVVMCCDCAVCALVFSDSHFITTMIGEI